MDWSCKVDFSFKWLLRWDRELLGSNSKHPRAVVLCALEERVEQCFNAARYIIENAELKSAKNSTSSELKSLDVLKKKLEEAMNSLWK
ncbi:hypothetical protein MTR_0571s0020 [Medicago truncatula]|uniref:Uncharacterized protein n=1 Tax=Medicago truncatula TaxID=3880 RepID=A0A072TQC0_MEDTR|nr:hypothetical protein MTR_0571s0020 [Medicago truncatula]